MPKEDMYMFGVDLRYKGYQVSLLRVEGWLTTQLLSAPGQVQVQLYLFLSFVHAWHVKEQLYLYLYGSQSSYLFPYTPLTKWFL